MVERPRKISHSGSLSIWQFHESLDVEIHSSYMHEKFTHVAGLDNMNNYANRRDL